MVLSLLLYLLSYADGVNIYSTLLAGGFLSGLFGEVGLILMAGYSYVTDITGRSALDFFVGRIFSRCGHYIGHYIVCLGSD